MRINETICHPAWHRNEIEVYLLGPLDNFGCRLIGKPLEGDLLKDGEVPPPTTRLPMEVAQQLMDQLWLCGLRPTEGTGSAGSLAATEKHLNDMRAIVSKQLQVQLGGK